MALSEKEIAILSLSGYLLSKFIGYAISVLPLSWVFHQPQMASFKKALIFALLRLIMALLVVAFVLLVFTKIFNIDGKILYFSVVAVFRFIEWFLLIWFFFDRKWERTKLIIVCAFLGMIYSYLLDLPSILLVSTMGR